jgi:hypothetical protein
MIIMNPQTVLIKPAMKQQCQQKIELGDICIYDKMYRSACFKFIKNVPQECIPGGVGRGPQ